MCFFHVSRALYTLFGLSSHIWWCIMQRRMKCGRRLSQQKKTWDETLKDGSIFGLSFRLNFGNKGEKSSRFQVKGTGFRSFFDDSIYINEERPKTHFYDEHIIVRSLEYSSHCCVNVYTFKVTNLLSGLAWTTGINPLSISFEFKALLLDHNQIPRTLRHNGVFFWNDYNERINVDCKSYLFMAKQIEMQI